MERSEYACRQGEESIMKVKSVTIYSKANCPYCDRVKDLFEVKGIAYEEIRADLDEQVLADLLARTQWRTFPQVFINDAFVGGFDDVWALDQKDQLEN